MVLKSYLKNNEKISSSKSISMKKNTLRKKTLSKSFKIIYIHFVNFFLDSPTTLSKDILLYYCPK